MKIGIFQDIHANLPAFKEAIEFFQDYACSKIIHVGDLIGIGPHPKEVMEHAFSVNNMDFIMGNHDHWYAHGLPNPIPDYMSDDEVDHHKWVHLQLGEVYKSKVQSWPFTVQLELGVDKTVTFQHYGLNKQRNWFKSFIKDPIATDMDQLFDGIITDFVFYGHHHEASDLTGMCRYVNLGSAGCYDKPEVRLGILELINNDLQLQKYSIPYEDNGLMQEYDKRTVPARHFIKKVFITRPKS